MKGILVSKPNFAVEVAGLYNKSTGVSAVDFKVMNKERFWRFGPASSLSHYIGISESNTQQSLEGIEITSSVRTLPAGGNTNVTGVLDAHLQKDNEYDVLIAVSCSERANSVHVFPKLKVR